MTMLSTLNKLDLCRLICLLLMVTGVKLTRNTYREELLLLVSFDGFRWDYLERDLTPTLNDLAKHGSRGGYIINPFATKTLPSHFTTVTGLYEESHGLIGTKMYDPVLNETFHRNNTSTKWWSQTGQEPIWITNQRQGGSSAVIEYPGMDVPFGGMRPDYEFSHFSYSIPFDKRSDFAVSLLANGSINFAAIYFQEPDLTGHQHGPDSFEMNDTLKLCDNTVKHLIKELKKVDLLHVVNIIFTSDHGMISVDKSRTIYAENYLNDTIYPHFTTEDNPVLSIWPRKESHVEPLYQSLKSAPHVTVYKKDEIPDGYHYKNNIRVAPIVAVADEGWMLVAKNWDPWQLSYKGNHGFNNSLNSMFGFFIAHGPAFKKGGLVDSFPSVDIYPLMCHILDIKPNSNNGTMAIVSMLLHTSPSSWKVFVLGVTCVLLTGCFLVAVKLLFRQIGSQNMAGYHRVHINDETNS